jgi:uncharacterized Tic20 family protein
MEKESKKLVEKLTKNKSNLSIRLRIALYSILKKVNSEKILFILSLTTTLLFGYLVGNVILLSLFSHFILWFLFNQRFIDKSEMKEENEEISKIIKELKKYVSKKKGVK